MQVGDLVKNGIDGACFGIIIRQVNAFDGDVWWLVQWAHDQRDTLNERLLEVINESR